MRFGVVGDIIGRVGREMVKHYIPIAKEKYKLDVVVANAENASGGFGLSCKNALELLSYGVDIITGGNHSWDKREIESLLSLEHSNILRPHNYPKQMVGSGLFIGALKEGKITTTLEDNASHFAIINLMGHFGMPHCDNAFIYAKEMVASLHNQGIRQIVMDFHAEATSEKRSMLFLLKSQISAVLGTHTHVGTDDLEIYSGTLGVSDIGGTGARDGVIGMNREEPIERLLTSIPVRLSIPKPNECLHLFQMIIFETNTIGQCQWAKKLKAIDDGELVETLKAV